MPSFCPLLLISCRPAAVHYQASHQHVLVIGCLSPLLTRNDHHKIAGDHRRTAVVRLDFNSSLCDKPPVSSLSSLMLSRLTNPEQSRSEFPSQPHQPRTLGWIIPLFRD